MDDILSRGLLPVGKVRHGSESRYSHAHTIYPPHDSYNLVYLAMVLSGAGFLLPYNSFITAVDYFQTVFPGTTIVFDISLIYILTALIAVLLNNVIIYTFSLNSRIMFGYILSFLILMFILIFIILLDMFPGDQTYTMILVCVALISVGATVQQSSFYGLTCMLPARYTQAVMAGESVAGLLSSVSRIITKSITSKKSSTVLFFTISIVTILACIYTFIKVSTN
jgi:solute carrier family 29 (equilibrative nucleoside transporter) protein 4